MNDVDPVTGVDAAMFIGFARNNFFIASHRERSWWRERKQQCGECLRFWQRMRLAVHDDKHACTSSWTGAKVAEKLSSRKQGQRCVGADGSRSDRSAKTSSTTVGVSRNP